MRGIFTWTMLIICVSMQAQDQSKGYYKDLFMDSGIMLTSREDLPSARFCNFSMESFVSTKHSNDKPNAFTAMDTLVQNQMFAGSDIDENGILLYPDGAPRFRAIYVNGGRATKHGHSLGEKGRESYRLFVKNGGSYVGSCAGAFLASVGSKKSESETKVNPDYLGVWPSRVCSTGLERSWTHIDIVPGSPLLNYYQFGGRMQIDSVRHNGGCFAVMDNQCPEGTEVLARYSTPGMETKRNMVGQPVVWAWKENTNTGRVVLCGSHPEEVTEGPRLELTAAMLKYAMDGNGKPRIKGGLEFGKMRKMACYTHENNPDYARLGDRQYHHFTVNVPEGLDSLVVSLESIPGWRNFDLYLFANYEDFAFKDGALYSNLTLGVDKKILMRKPKAGRLFVSVFCDTTVDAKQTKHGTQYSGRVDVLNGVPYIIKVMK